MSHFGRLLAPKFTSRSSFCTSGWGNVISTSISTWLLLVSLASAGLLLLLPALIWLVPLLIPPLQIMLTGEVTVEYETGEVVEIASPLQLTPVVLALATMFFSLFLFWSSRSVIIPSGTLTSLGTPFGNSTLLVFLYMLDVPLLREFWK